MNWLSWLGSFLFEDSEKDGWITAALICVVLGFGCWYLYGEAVKAKESASHWQTAALEGQRALKEMDDARQALEKALAARQTRLKEEEARSAGLREKLREAARRDKKVHDWGAVPLPDTVRQLLKDN